LNEGVIATAWEGRTPDQWREQWRIPSLLIFETTTSTNDVAMRLAAAGAPAGTTVIADRQTQGRGRDGRPWADSAGHSLLLSVVMRAADEPADPSTVPLRTGLGVALAIEHVAGITTRIKWPNDVLSADGRKLAGVLCEGSSGAGLAWLVAGIGVNVSQRARDFEPAIAPTAASIAMAGAAVARHTLAGRILDLLRPFLIEPPPLEETTLKALEARDALRGQQVSVNNDVACTAEGIAADGTLRIRRHGRHDALRSGTVRLIHPDSPGPAPTSQPATTRNSSEANRCS